jgi:hypothetical protein
MRHPSIRFRRSSTGALAVVGAVLVAACAERAPFRSTAPDPSRVDISELWLEPRDLETRNFYDGPGGAALAPDLSGPYQLLKVDHHGFSPGYDVRDGHGTKWSVKLGIEAQPEVVASRVLWGIGYYQPATYLVTKWRLAGQTSGVQGPGRFRPESSRETVIAEWSWYQNPFVGTRPLNGLLVANVILNNWDWKTSNNKLYEMNGDGRPVRRRYVVRDLGASLGKTTYPRLMKWIPLRGFGQGTRNDVDGFESQGFIKSVKGNHVTFHYRGIQAPLLKSLTVDDVVWTCSLMARISDQQWRDAFRAAAYDEATQERFIAKLKATIREGLALRLSGDPMAPHTAQHVSAVRVQHSDEPRWWTILSGDN